MEFGRVPEDELNAIDFSLPKEPADNKNILKGKPFKKAKVYVGAPNGAAPNGWAKFIRPKQKRKIFCSIM